MTFQFKIQIEDIKSPLVWRRIVVPAEISFYMLHELIQEAFGWVNTHMYAFSPSGYGTKPWLVDDDYNDISAFDDSTSADTTLLSNIFITKGQTFTYHYGADWTHKIILEEIDKLNIAPSAKLLAGEGASPREEFGDSAGYEHFKEVIANEKHPEYQDYIDWLIQDEEVMEFYKEGEPLWDPYEFDLDYEKDWFDDLFEIII